MNLNELSAGDKVIFACGGEAVVREVDLKGPYLYPIRIKLNGFHAANCWWIFNTEGENGDGTGPVEEICPFDIVKLDKPYNG